MRLSRALVGVALLAFAFAGHASAQPSNGGRFVPGEILVKFKPGATAASKADAHKSAGGARRAEIARTGVQLVAVAGADQSAAIARYRRNPNVLYAEPNFIRTLPVPAAHAPGTEVVPADFYFPEQWALHNTGQQFLCISLPPFGNLCFYVGTPDADIDAPEAWAISTGSPSVTVAVIDTGIDYTHPDLRANYAGGDDFLTPDGDPMDDQGHGTHVAGTIAAALNNPTGDPAREEGVVGVAPNTRLLAYKVCAADATCSDFAIEQAIARAVVDGARVINMSFGSPEYSRSLDDAIQEAWRAGLVIVAAAGNDGTTNPLYPAALENVISVAAFDEDHNRATFSTYGDWVDISAPGNVIVSSYPIAACADPTVPPPPPIPGDTGCYTWLSGTSMAAPHVAGAAALVWSRGDVTTNSQVVDILLGSADPVGIAGARLDSWTRHGGLNIHDALSFARTNLPPVASAGPDQSVDDLDGDGVELLTLDGSASSDPDGSIVGYVWREGSTDLGSGSTVAVWLPVGSHTLTLEATDDHGATATDDVTVVINHINQPPASADFSTSTVVGTPVTVTMRGSDLETCELSFSIVQGPASGTLGTIQDQPCAAGNPYSDTAQIVYTPSATGTYSFTYRASDGAADSNTATATIAVNAPPVVPLTVTGISPNVVSQNAGRITFAVMGTGFANGATVAFLNGSGQAPRVLAVRRISSSQLAVDTQIRSGGPKKNRFWDVQVTNVDGTAAVGRRLLTMTP